MSNVRTLLAGSLASVLGLSMPQSVRAQEPDTGITHAEVRKKLYDRATRVTYDTWKPHVLNYDGAVIVLFTSLTGLCSPS
ncbi:MAG TPA: hypothetical protein HA360_02880 [Nanoarchaeota archaeon]|nr:hypothetical protein [Candidatus Woesearchaeota archaeon]HIH15358.1 hypothetical protein [Nanoarchaeota archaeon]HIH58994.1 hypothetical protein [Nanoarchaeota archaeon]HII13995.1 hypothetical protein [Nanoarchaeota archaeon]HIJ05479.1 hypothetical protein [Nanoarchaeota archaeon]